MYTLAFLILLLVNRVIKGLFLHIYNEYVLLNMYMLANMCETINLSNLEPDPNLAFDSEVYDMSKK